ncbi:alpha/beta fold hydrolase [Plantactinospora sp. B5E13]|uniref:alpha/beta fold hydrolase n=1 Tax=Plantactinospora sp. B5E13 TaxID=3153758 RepID=UPI00325EFBA7
MRLISLLAVSVLLVSGTAIASTPMAAASAGSGSAGQGRYGTPPRFAACADQALAEAGVECATLRVPVDHRRPEGPTIELAVSRIRAGDVARRRGVLMFNPGGPGGAGLDYPLRLRPVLGDVAGRYDLVGFDPRFVGRSTPITCGPVRLGDVARSAGLDRAGFAESVRLSADFARRCHERNAALLPYAGIRDVARDMDLIRTVLGEPRLSYYGVSWGADLGAVYSELFPDRVDRMVLDSVSAVESEYDLNRAGGARAEAALEEWAAGRGSGYPLGDSPAEIRSSVRNLLAQAAQRPIEIGGHRVDDNILPFVIRNWLGDEANDEVLATTLYGLTRAAAGHPVTPAPELAALLDLLNLRDPMIEGVMASSFAVFCADPRWPYGPAEYWRNVQRSRVTEPVFGPLVNNVTPCAFWPGRATEPPLRVAHGVPLLMVQAARDNSPYPLALDLHRRLTASRLVTADRRTHGLYPRRVDGREPLACVERAVNEYLERGVLPSRDVWC